MNFLLLLLSRTEKDKNTIDADEKKRNPKLTFSTIVNDALQEILFRIPTLFLILFVHFGLWHTT